MSFLCVFAVLGVFALNSDLSNATKWNDRVQRTDREDAKKEQYLMSNFRIRPFVT